VIMFRAALRSRLPTILAVVGGGMLLAGIYLFYVADGSGAVTPEPSTGRVFANNNHGRIRYVTWEDSTLINGLQFGGWVLWVTSIWISGRRAWKR
jgi:hypothetical protein